MPLDGIKVLDLSRVLAGPFCASMLADLGASVTKVEMPVGGDDSRHFTPHIDGESSYFMLVNRGKKSFTLDMKSSDGLTMLKRLVQSTDIIVENFRPGVTSRLGIDYTTLSELNPRLIYVSISGFGQTGPFAHRPAYDHIVQAMGGVMSVTGWPGDPPTRIGDAVGDVVAGIYGAWGALAALLQRAKTGTGQHVDIAMLDAMMSLQVVALSQLVAGAPNPGRVGNAHSVSAPMDSYAARDGHVVIAVANDALFARLTTAIGRPELPRDVRFESDAARYHHREDLRPVIEAWTSVRSVNETVDELSAAGVPAGPIWNLSEALASDHARHRSLMRDARHPRAGTVSVMPQIARLSGSAEPTDLGAPSLGQHTDEILRDEFGLRPSESAALRAAGVV
ncbi:CaiB/BaiF CoA transferase family protein [uncultured Enterovirga sp.]|uniref:CaiB/BaiF CoA transferase family protein n=1 Tax=uncultured Enterovirga sp. TaxID=2026352 RepID=UPI0035CC051A